jgi:CDP-paratose 2-epimerase
MLQAEVARHDVVHHLAGQVAVTTSVQDPRSDFESNALGTFNVLEAVRAAKNCPTMLYASTNKVYGGMTDAVIVERGTRYEYRDRPEGIDERQNLDFHSPYGCSKGAGDQYVRDYARIYGLRTVVMRQSCIYGPRQFGMEDQGWVAWFTIAALLGKKITVYGDGKQIRDLLHVDDLFDAWGLAERNIDVAAGQVYNVGGGPRRTLSLLELLAMLTELLGREIPVEFADWRPGDQRVYVSDIRKARDELEWEPKTDVNSGVRRLYQWVVANQDLLQEVSGQ